MTELLRVFFDDSPVGKTLVATDGSWRRINRAFAAMLGYSIEELTGLSLMAVTHPGDVAEAMVTFQTLLAGERETASAERRFLAKDGGVRWCNVGTSLFYEGDDRRAHVLTTAFDITERKNASDDLRASESRYRRLFESAKDGILILDGVTGCIIDVNPFITELIGFKREDFLGHHLWELGSFRDIAASKEKFTQLQEMAYVRYEDLPLKTHDGREIAVEIVSNIYLVDGKKIIQCNVRDITVRKRAEDELQMRDRALRAVSLGIIVTDVRSADNVITYASPGFTELTGYTSQEVMGSNCRFLQGKDTDPSSVAVLRNAIREGRACTVELLNVRKDGSPFWNSVAISPIKGADGALTGFVGVQTDVTARRQLEAQFRQAQKMEAVGRLAGGVAHDFNNLLSVILSYAEMIVSDLQHDEPLRDDVEQIRLAGLRASELTQQLLAFSRQQVLAPEVMNLNEVICRMEKLLHRLLGADIEITLLLARDLSNVKADPGQIEQIIMNLAVNARDAMPRGGKLTVETTNHELDEDYSHAHLDVRAGSYVELAVSDTGTGMNKETLARVFEPFFTTKDKGKGTGLGLATVFGIVRQTGGHIFVYSEPGHGTAFKIYLPIVGEVAQPRHASALDAVDDGTERGNATILLVEDEDQVRSLAVTILRRKGYVVLQAANGGEALLICEQHPARIDLLVTDVVLPLMSGRQLAERLALIRPTMKVLYMSGYTDDAVLQHGIVESGVAFLQKPLTPTLLARKVREVLRVEPGLAGPPR